MKKKLLLIISTILILLLGSHAAAADIANEIIGEWDLVMIEQDDLTIDIAASGQKGSLTFSEDGTAKLDAVNADGQTYTENLRWTEKDGKTIVTDAAGDDPMECSMEGEYLILRETSSASTVTITCRRPSGSASASASGSMSANVTIKWDEKGLFLIDTSILGKTFQEVKAQVGVELAQPAPWEYWGDGRLTWCSWDNFERPSVMFMFEGDRLVQVYNDIPYAGSEAVYDHVTDPSTQPASGNGTGFHCWIETYGDTGVQYIRQMYSTVDWMM